MLVTNARLGARALDYVLHVMVVILSIMEYAVFDSQ